MATVTQHASRQAEREAALDSERRDALERATEVRVLRAALKGEIKAGRESIVDILRDPPAYLHTAEIAAACAGLVAPRVANELAGGDDLARGTRVRAPSPSRARRLSAGLREHPYECVHRPPNGLRAGPRRVRAEIARAGPCGSGSENPSVSGLSHRTPRRGSGNTVRWIGQPLRMPPVNTSDSPVFTAVHRVRHVPRRRRRSPTRRPTVGATRWRGVATPGDPRPGPRLPAGRLRRRLTGRAWRASRAPQRHPRCQVRTRSAGVADRCRVLTPVRLGLAFGRVLESKRWRPSGFARACPTGLSCATARRG